jgi:hypothetical protein
LLTESNDYDPGCRFLLEWYVQIFLPEPAADDWSFLVCPH